MRMESPMIREVHYDGTRAKLIVRFDDGCAYVFVGVPDEAHQGLVQAASLDAYFADMIFERYPYNRLDGDPVRGIG